MIFECCTFLLLTIALGRADLFDESESKGEEKNVFTGFRGMIAALTGDYAVLFNNHGNYCGLGGSGEALDDLDRCCKAHDECYGVALNTTCKEQLPGYIYVATYDYIADGKNKKIKCLTAKESKWSSAVKWFSEKKFTCGFDICMCDFIAAKCFNLHKADLYKTKSGG